MPKPKIGIALGSGAARGWAHVGVLQELSDQGIEPDIVCGCSMGALVGAVYVADGLDELQKWASKIDWKDIIRFLDVDLTSGGLIEGKHIMSFMRSISEDAVIENFEKPFIAVATDLMTGREVWLREGSVVKAVRGSIAMPGLFSPVELDGRWLVDGGLVNPVPVSACRALGADIIFAVNLNDDIIGKLNLPENDEKKPDEASVNSPNTIDTLLKKVPLGVRKHLEKLTPELWFSKRKTPGYFDVTASSINIMQDHITRSRLAGEPPHVMITPQLAHIGMLELDRAKEAIKEGRDSVKREIAKIQNVIG